MPMFDEIDRLCARRIQDGTKKYGVLDLPTDPRNFIHETQEELLDAINYIRFDVMRGRIPPILGALYISYIKALYDVLKEHDHPVYGK